MLIGERLTLNPLTEDTALQGLDFVGTDPSWGIYLLSHDYTPPEVETQHASSADTEGDPVVQNRYGNRTISVRVRIVEPEDPASTNLALNPVGGINTTSWDGLSLVSGPTRVTPSATPTGLGIDTAIEAKTNAAFDAVRLTTANLTNGKTYRASLYVQLVAKTSTAAFRIAIYDTEGEEAFLGATKVEVVSPEWVRLDISFKAYATGAWRIGLQQTAAGTGTVYVTGVLVEESEKLGPYFSGDTPGCDWSTTRHGSTSTRPAPDGTRFKRIYRDLTSKLDRIKREKVGTLRRTAAVGGPLTFDLRGAKLTDAPQDLSIGMKRAELGIAFEALPGGRGPEVQIGGNFDELALPVQQFLAENIPGELPALGRLLIEDRQGQAQLAAWWGLQQRNYSASADAALFYEAETRTPLGSSATAELAGASGAGKNTILNASLVNAYQGIFSTQASGAGNHLAHVGSYRVLARMYRPTTNTGEVTVKFAWAEGDFVAIEENDEISFAVEEREGIFTIEDLGIVTVDKAPAGATQRWEGRLLAKSTVSSDDLYVDWLMLIPIDEGSGEARASSALTRPAQISAFDPFDGVVGGALAGKAAGIGGNWAGAGDADDFTVDTTNHRAQRTALSDVANTPRYATIGAAKYTDIAISALVGSNNPADEAGSSLAKLGVLARYVDVNNWLGLFLYRGGVRTLHVGPLIQENLWYGMLLKKVAGVVSVVSAPIEESSGSWGSLVAALNGTTIQGTIELAVLANGEWRVGFNGKQLRSGNDPVLNSAGVLKEGLIGIVDEKTSALAETRFYDSIEAWVPSSDYAMYANRILEIDSDRVRRQDSTGTTWGEPPYEGDYLLIPPAGPEKRTTRFVVKGSRNPESDGGIDDIRSKLFVTPRYLMAPPT